MIVKSIHLNQWASTLDSKGILPLLARKLIFASLNFDDIKSADFPAEEDTYIGGYDGILKTSIGNKYIPEGDSVWEFGTNSDTKTKANKDYAKRTKDSLGVTKSETTFVFLTSRVWVGKTEWAEEKNKEGIWKDVKCYDATDLEQWLDIARGVDYWMANHLRLTTEGVYIGEDFWSIWSKTDKFEFPPEILIGGREAAVISLKHLLLDSTGTATYMKAPTTDEALAFILATIVSMESKMKESILSKTLIPTDTHSLQRLINEKRQLIIIPKCQIEEIDIAKAKSNNHIIIVPSTINSSKKNDEIVLPIIEFEPFIESLKKMGIGNEKSRQLSKNTARNISVLRRTLKVSDAEPKWYTATEKRSLLPILLLARFKSTNQYDREIVQNISEKKYSEFEKTLRELLALEETNVLFVNDNWRLISHTDSWLFMAKHITAEDLERFTKIAIEVLSEHNPALDLKPEERYMAAIHKAIPKYSTELKRGIAETLIILSVYGEEFGVNCGFSPELYVNNIIREILKNGDANTWRSLSSNLMRLGEAAPSIMLEEIDSLVTSDKLDSFFEVEDTMLSKNSYLPYLLWTLEQIAWMPENLSKVSLIICQLIEKGPKDYPNANTPLATLNSIYRSWYPQTLAPLKIRIKALELIRKRFPDIAYILFNNLIGKQHDVAFHGSRMEWRLFNNIEDVSVTNRERSEMEDFAISNLIELAGNSPAKISSLIDKLDVFTNVKINDALEHISNNIPTSEEDRSIVYHAFRNLIGKHRSFQQARWALPIDILNEFETVALKFEPKDLVLKDIYLFEDSYPEFFEGKDEMNIDENNKIIVSKRVDFLIDFLKSNSLDDVIELASTLEYPMYLGEALAKITLDENIENKILNLLGSKIEKNEQLASQYVRTKESQIGFKTCIEIFNKLKTDNANEMQQSLFLLALSPNVQLWKFIETLNNKNIEEYYWQNKYDWVPPDEESFKYAISKFLQYDRTIAVLNHLGHPERVKKYETTDIIKLLRDAKITDFVNPTNSRLHTWSIQNIFSELDSRADIVEDEIAVLELKYLFDLNDFNSKRKPRFLFKAIAKEPELFSHFLNEVYVPNGMSDEEKAERRSKRTKEESDLIFSKHKILENINIIPGTNDEAVIDGDKLKAWISKVRELAKKDDRLESVEGVIGTLLSKYPKGLHETWFPSVILETLEEINSHRMLLMFEIGITNSRGVTVRGAHAGGNLEYDQAKIYDEIYNLTYVEFPIVSNVFKRIRDDYNRRAKREDNEALGGKLNY
ncbi:hypothetical protein [Winogradskyella sp. PE311]|uniref:hypothetical protein n=1 Tax=Winogradskyella sp. PE311 TaxID=3366943 RepID=UPI0039813108